MRVTEPQVKHGAAACNVLQMIKTSYLVNVELVGSVYIKVINIRLGIRGQIKNNEYSIIFLVVAIEQCQITKTRQHISRVLLQKI